MFGPPLFLLCSSPLWSSTLVAFFFSSLFLTRSRIWWFSPPTVMAMVVAPLLFVVFVTTDSLIQLCEILGFRYFWGSDFNADFEDYSEDNSNDVSAAGPIVPAVGQNYSNSTNPISAAGPSNINTNLTHGKSSLQDASKPPDMLESEDIIYSDHENVGAEADFNNLETSITVSPILTTRIHNAHPVS
nr:hypothetical protein [Tanacetum cinerariifolium]